MHSPLLPWALLCLSYFLGCLMPGYCLVRWRMDLDVRELGNGGTGASNVGRVYGIYGFALVFVLDFLKGSAAVLLALWFCGPSSWVIWACPLAVVLGHVWPCFLSFRGGRGISALLGAWLVLEPQAFLFCAPVLVVAWLVFRRFTPAGLCALCVLPTGASWASRWHRLPALWAGLCLLVVLIAHREYLRRWLFPESFID